MSDSDSASDDAAWGDGAPPPPRRPPTRRSHRTAAPPTLRQLARAITEPQIRLAVESGPDGEPRVSGCPPELESVVFAEVAIRETGWKGRGLFAVAPIACGAVVLRQPFVGRLTAETTAAVKAARGLPPDAGIALEAGAGGEYLDVRMALEDLASSQSWWYAMNHACGAPVANVAPQGVTTGRGAEGDRAVFWRALRDIVADEELCWDYGTARAVPVEGMTKCHCVVACSHCDVAGCPNYL